MLYYVKFSSVIMLLLLAARYNPEFPDSSGQEKEEGEEAPRTDCSDHTIIIGIKRGTQSIHHILPAYYHDYHSNSHHIALILGVMSCYRVSR